MMRSKHPSPGLILVVLCSVLLGPGRPAGAQDEPPPSDGPQPGKSSSQDASSSPEYMVPPAQRVHLRAKGKLAPGSQPTEAEKIEKAYGVVLWHRAHKRTGPMIETAQEYARKGSVKVMALLAEFYEKGEGVPRDMDQAVGRRRG